MLNSMTEYFRKNVKFCIALIVKKKNRGVGIV